MSAHDSVTTIPRSRRAILAGALAGIGAAVAKAAAPLTTRAAGDDGAAVHIGDTFANAQAQTTIGNQANSNRVLWVASNTGAGHGDGVAVTGFSQSGMGVEGWSPDGTGVHGLTSNGTAVRAQSGAGFALHASSDSTFAVVAESGTGTGILAKSEADNATALVAWSTGRATALTGASTNTGLPGSRANTGVLGYAPGGTSAQGVRGESNSGTGVFGTSATGYALRTSGRVKIDKVSGVATITAGATSKTVSPGVNVTTGSFVLLTPKANIGSRSLWFTTNPTTNKITIHMSSSRSSATKVAWLLLG